MMRWLAHTPLPAAAAYLCFAIAAIIVWDIFDLFGWQSKVAYCDSAYKLVWFCLFRNNHLTEHFQWLLIGLSLATVIMGWKIACKRRDANARRVFAALATALALMLLEDAADTRHSVTRNYLPILLDQDPVSTTAKTIWELTYFSVIGALVVSAFIAAATVFRPTRATIGYLTGAVCLYGLATLMSGTRHVADWYAKVGTIITDTIPLPSDSPWARILDYSRTLQFDGTSSHPLEFFIMDSLIEESLELLAAAMILSAMMGLLHSYSSRGEATASHSGRQ